METVVRFEGMTQNILELLVAEGYFKTKSEAIRAGVLGLAKEYDLLNELKNDFEYAQKMDAAINSKKIKLASEKELFSAIKKKKSE